MKLRNGVALIMVLLVLSALAIIAGPFAASMALQDRASRGFEGEVKTRLAAEAARNHAIAYLQKTLYALESDLEAEEIDDSRPPDPEGKTTYQPATRKGLGINSSQGKSGSSPWRSGRRSLVRRADLGEPAARRQRNQDMGRRARESQGRAATVVNVDTPEKLLVSEKVPSPKQFDPRADIEADLPGPVKVDDPDDPQAAIGFDSSSVTVEDEQGKINILSAPPNLIANLLGVSRLAAPLEPGAVALTLEDGSPFRGDSDDRTLDGAVVLVHPENGRVEAVTYRTRRSNELGGLFRGAFLSVPYDEPFPRGSFVYDLRGYKIGHHQLRAHAEGSFAPARLADFASIEAVREIASWQIASLFIIRFRGEGLTAEFLQKNGMNERKLEELGLDPAIFGGDDPARNPILKAEYDTAVKSLKRSRVSATLIEALRKARGTRAVISLETRIGALKAAEQKKTLEDLEKSLKSDQRKSPTIDRKYLEAALVNLAEAYRTPGIETLLPEEFEGLRDAITVSSRVAAKWSEAQTNPDPLPAGPAWSESFRSARAGELGGGALVRIRLQKDPESVEYNRVIQRAKTPPVGGFQLAYPLLRGYPADEAWIDALQRHPVNVNTASERVLRAVFTGVSGYKPGLEGEQAVTPAEAARLASMVKSRGPLKSLEDFRALLVEAKGAGVIGPEDVDPLFRNAIQPNDPHLRVSTTGLCFATGDVYTIDASAVLRNEAGGLVASKRLREIVEISAPEPLRLGLFTQADYQYELFTRDPYSQMAPEDHALWSVSFPGVRGHLVTSTPLLLRNLVSAEALEKNFSLARFPLAGGDAGSLRLFTSETSERNTSTLSDPHHFRNFREGYELAPGEPFVLDITIPGTAGGGAAAGGGRAVARAVKAGSGAGGTGIIDLTNLPASVDFWARFRSYPETTQKDGLVIIVDSGSDEERNRISLLYDKSRSEFVGRIYDSSLPDPSIVKGKQFTEVRARRSLNLETWYHLRMAWDGSFAGGVQLFIDGLPAGTASFATELVSDLNPQGAGALALKDRSALPVRPAGPTDSVAVRVGSEIIELGNGQQIAQRKPSKYRDWLNAQIQKQQQQQQQQQQQRQQQGQPPIQPQPLPGKIVNNPEEMFMRAPWNGRGGTPAHSPRGTSVELHGYSLDIKRKLYFPASGVTEQAGGAQQVWTPGGLTLGDELLTWGNLPPEVLGIVHFAPPDLPSASGTPGTPAGPATGPSASSANLEKFVAPMFLIELGQNSSNVLPPAAQALAQQFQALFKQYFPLRMNLTVLSSEIMWAGETYNAAQFFQKEGVLMAQLPLAPANAAKVNWVNADIHYMKQQGALTGHPAGVPSTIAQYQAIFVEMLTGRGVSRLYPPVVDPQLIGLQVVRAFPVTGNTFKFTLQTDNGHLRPISVLANGSAANLYPPTGVLEVRGRPAPWCDPPRPDMSSAPLFGNHPDDTVEWIRYRQIYNDRIFVGWPTFEASHRGYPRDDRSSNQMFHQAGEPLRLVMELADGGAGYGDYVSIVTDDPSVCEPVVRRVYNVSERVDGRFFVSLVDVDESGHESMGVMPYKNFYSPSQNPRLVKFPGGMGALPQIGTGRMVFFGESGAGSQTGAASSGMNTMNQGAEEEAKAGIVLDEIRQSLNKSMPREQGYGRMIKHVLVPLQDGAVHFEPNGPGGGTISGIIPEGKSISRDSPQEVLVVSVGRSAWPFAQNVKEGMLRIGDELFFFENPAAGDGKNLASAGGASTALIGAKVGTLNAAFVVAPNTNPNAPVQSNKQWDYAPPAPADFIKNKKSPYYYYYNKRTPEDRSFTWKSPPASITGKIEKQGFLRVNDVSPWLRGFYEIFYYQEFRGNEFDRCLRGVFQTPFVSDGEGVDRSNAVNGVVTVKNDLINVTTKLRLVGRCLLGTEAATHGMGDVVSYVPYLDYTEITGALTDTELGVKDTKGFPPMGYLLLDPAQNGLAPFEIMAYGGLGEGLFRRIKDERGKGQFRALFGTVERPIDPGMFAYGMPYRYFDRYQPEVESEGLAYFQKSFRMPGAHWRSIEWRERRPRGGVERLCDIVVAARFDGSPDWSAKPSNRTGGLWLLEDQNDRKRTLPNFPLDVWADEMEVRVYFRYKKGAFMRVSRDVLRDDWKETPILEWLAVEYEKAGRILRHEEPPQ